MTASAPARKSKFGLFVKILGAVIIIPVVGVGVLLATFDADKYRGDIAGVLSEKLGRKVSLNGPMHLGVMGGLALEINDAAVANPEWASRPEMAKIGKLALALKLAPLLHKELAIDSVILNDADVQLETNAGGAKNWDFALLKTSAPQSPQAGAAEKQAAKAAGKENNKLPIDLNINQMKLKNVRFAMRDAAKKETVVMIASLTLEGAGKTALKANGAFNQQPFDVTLNGAPWQDLLANKNWPFQAAAAFAGNEVTGQGIVSHLGTMVELSGFTLKSAIGSNVDGKMNMNFLGKPSFSGSVHVDVIKPPADDTQNPAADTVAAAPEAAPQDSRMFSDAKIDLSALKSVNAEIRLTVDRIEGGGVALANFYTVLVLQGGVLNNVFSAQVAGNPVKGRLELNAVQQPAALQFVLTGQQMDLNPLLKTAGSLGVVLGKSDLDIDVRSRGDSARSFASNLDGKIMIQTGKGTIPLQGFKFFSGNLIRALLPGAEAVNDLNLTCGTMRFQAQNGVLNSNGILFESNLTTVVGAGAVNLGQENLNLNFKPQPKDGTLGKIAPMVRVDGSLKAPAVKIDAASAVAGLAGQFLGANIPGNNGMQVPVVNPRAVGNPCADALDHPVYATTNAAPTSAAGVAVEKGRAVVQDKLGKLLGGDKSPLKGLFGQ